MPLRRAYAQIKPVTYLGSGTGASLMRADTLAAMPSRKASDTLMGRFADANDQKTENTVGIFVLGISLSAKPRRRCTRSP